MELDDPDVVLADDGAKDEIELDDSEEVLSVDDDDGEKEEIELDDSDDSFAEDDGSKEEIELDDSELLFTDDVVIAGLETALDWAEALVEFLAVDLAAFEDLADFGAGFEFTS